MNMPTLQVDPAALTQFPLHYVYLFAAIKKTSRVPCYMVEVRGSYVGDRDVYVPKFKQLPAFWVHETHFWAWLHAICKLQGRALPPFETRQIALKAMPEWMRSPPPSAVSTPSRARSDQASSPTQPPTTVAPAALVLNPYMLPPVTPSRIAPEPSATVQLPPLTPDTPELAEPSDGGSDTESDGEDEEAEAANSDMELDGEADDRSSIAEERELSMTPRGSRKWPVTLTGGPASEQTPCNFTAYLADLFAPDNKKKRRHEDADDVLDAKRRRLEARRAVA